MNINIINNKEDKESVEIGDIIITTDGSEDNIYMIFDVAGYDEVFNYGLLNLKTYEFFGTYSNMDNFRIGEDLAEYDRIKSIVKSKNVKLDIII